MAYDNPFPEFIITSQAEAENVVRRDKKKWNVISIYSGDRGRKGQMRPLEAPQLQAAKSVFESRFHDIDKEDPGLTLCNEKHIMDILNYARDKRGEPLLIHCHAGISRSAAIMFLILLDAILEKSDWPAEDALGMVYANRPVCYPNRHILHLGIKIIARENWLLEVQLMRQLYNSADFKRIYG